GITAVFLTTIVPKIMRRDTTMMLVLSGVIISGFMNSIMGLIKYIADPETELAEITYWQMGSISKVTMDNIVAIAPIIIICGFVLIALRWRINIMSMGENEAKTLGVNLSLERGIAIFCATLITASSVCLSGTIGWIGLVIPHFARLLVGNNNTRVLPVATIMSSCFLIVIDTLARTLTGGEIPISILTGFIGAPFFTWVLVKQRMSE
ncbi:MAG: FecCD family ABC transporter permease, partial [Intestinibacter sp.]|uniref:FecCD family ABC transporter permease n=1 Tax=Intestinibacter sp. TaxID=1965304 RepID=UPI003F16BEE8